MRKTTGARHQIIPALEPSFLDKLFWLSPRTWWGILELQASSSFSAFCLEHFIHGICGVLLPMFVYLCLRHLEGNILTTMLVSPWMLASVATVQHELRAVSRQCASWTAARKAVPDDALQVLLDGVQLGRIHCSRRFHVYFPPTYQGQALLFFPGACVPIAAYAKVASQLSDQGLVVAMISMEPLLLPHRNLGANAGRMRRIMNRVDRELAPSPAQWSLGGHSMGSFAAMHLVAKLQPANLILWAIAPFAESRTNIFSHDCKVLVVQGSNDILCQYTHQQFQEFCNDLPPNALHKTIRGGTHNGFASYPSNPAIDGIPGITEEKQHRQVTKATSDFIFRNARG